MVLFLPLRPKAILLTVALIAAGCAGQRQRARQSEPVQREEAPKTTSAPETRPAPAARVEGQRNRTGASLYDRLGGQSAIRKVVDDLVELAANDPKVNFTRRGQPNEWEATEENVERLKERVVQFVAVTAGARDVRYEGKDMVTAHKGMGITNGEFDAFATHLKAALEKNNVPRQEQEELLDAVESTRGAIVEEGGTE